jgi:hypothetical protein
MTVVSEILAELQARGIRFELRPHGGVRLVPSHLIDPPLLDRIRAHKTELLARLHAEQREAGIDRLARADGWTPLPSTEAPAYSIISTCQGYGVALRIDQNGDLVVGKDGAQADEPTLPWRSLLNAIEAHLDDVSALVEAGWTLKGQFPKQNVA